MSHPFTRRAFLGSAAVAALAAGRRPNVLFIPVDDMNDWVAGFGGHPQTITPNIARIEKRGMIFQRAYCNAPMCNPSRASLLTSRRPTTTAVYWNDDTWRDGAPTAVTLPEYFMKNGYRVAAGGKIFHSKQTDFGCFHEYYKDQEEEDDDAPASKKQKKSILGWKALDAPDEQTSDTKVALWAIDFLHRRHEQPFFLAPGFRKPHLPWNVPKKYFAKFQPERTELPAYRADDLDDVPKSATSAGRMANFHRIRDAGKWNEAVAAYLACINYTDANIGRVLDALDASPHRDNTIIVLWGDHGWHLGEKDHWQKFTLWERSCHAPLVIAAPGVTRPGSETRKIVEYIDIYPTLLELCGLPANPDAQGRSFVPLMKDPKREWRAAAVTSYGPDHTTVRTDGWRYSRHPDGEELYDETQDPDEWTNLAGKPEFAGKKRELAALFPREVNRKRMRSWQGLPVAEQERLRRKPLG
ncbi:MAG TPA: sulfatase [Bryobacteraceae bacterium]|jgi:arylsulfatase A-like enzyme|nr:sulfatase [Bryobacteraceae bacterium]